ncbi:hypothetical protein BDQ12DRAFT_730130 [Crucibulum laeve]|uniref:Uncharacterized protein n=1 Tax=Crucibulum laeve TaxID=68775 RepID=A0A5C3LDT5_9AGAR|nr:hypothetical protein BDQ12DRAFT_730130 [Crucibulum laeve]
MSVRTEINPWLSGDLIICASRCDSMKPTYILLFYEAFNVRAQFSIPVAYMPMCTYALIFLRMAHNFFLKIGQVQLHLISEAMTD